MLRKGVTVEEIHKATIIDYFFLQSFASLIEKENEITAKTIDLVTKEELQLYKEKGFSDRYLASVWKVSEIEVRAHRKSLGITAVYKTVDGNDRSSSRRGRHSCCSAIVFGRNSSSM